ncbi:unnamed protein product [Rangifer tarandus platyrhynchus]|uniref:Secreted protein n=1 Tax=Rangifer tarandus platyrhynchus TaxID=3082113 RepID=A0ABN8YSJ7_RANTA|nr:unnamed protein product [Rangifer tarandus platyrhynchus]
MSRKVLLQLSLLLCYPVPLTWKNTAGQVYEMVLTYNVVAAGILDEVMAVVSSTAWDTKFLLVRACVTAWACLDHSWTPSFLNFCDAFEAVFPVAQLLSLLRPSFCELVIQAAFGSSEWPFGLPELTLRRFPGTASSFRVVGDFSALLGPRVIPQQPAAS